VTDVSFNQESSRVAFGCSEGTVGVLNLKTKKKDILTSSHSKGQPIVAVQFNSNDQLLASGSSDGTICVMGLGEQRTMISLAE
jgi:WD40 repeat protein